MSELRSFKNLKNYFSEEETSSYFLDIRTFFSTVFRLFRLISTEYKKTVLKQLVIILFSALLPFLAFYSFGALISCLSDKNNHYLIWLILVLATIVLTSYLKIIKTYQDAVFKYDMEYFFRFKVVEKIISLDIATIEEAKNQDLFTRVREHAGWRVPRFITTALSLSYNVLAVAIAFIIISTESTLIAALIFILSLPKLFSYFQYAKKVWRTDKEISEIRRKCSLTNWTLNDPGCLSEIKLFGSHRFFIGDLKEKLKLMFSKELKTKKAHLDNELWLESLNLLSVAAALILLTLRVDSGAVALGRFTFLIASLFRLLNEMNAFTTALGSQLEDTRFMKDLFTLFDLSPKIKENPKNGIKLAENNISVEFNNVTFSYRGQKTPAISKASFKINAKETVGLVGANGAGKTTLIKLICRIYDPDSGDILVNGVNLKELSIHEWHKKLGVLFQDFGTYPHLSAKENIGLSDEAHAICLNAVQNSATITGADKFISELPNGYDTILGKWFEQGKSLSGGELQKIALSRVLYRNPSLIILDEPTSSIDSSAEKLIFDNLSKYYSQATKILISHRFNTLTSTDRILVLEKGEIIENGSHQELLNKRGVYATCFQEQAASYMGNNAN